MTRTSAGGYTIRNDAGRDVEVLVELVAPDGVRRQVDLIRLGRDHEHTRPRMPSWAEATHSLQFKTTWEEEIETDVVQMISNWVVRHDDGVVILELHIDGLELPLQMRVRSPERLAELLSALHQHGTEAFS